MPLFYQHNINDDTKLGVWKIGENEDFFLIRVPLQRSISHPHKRLQHLAGRYLLQYLFPDFPYGLIQIADTRKPFLSNDAYHFSISHCGDYAAVVVSRSSRVGVDIELIKPSIEKIKQKFLREDEMQMLVNSGINLLLPPAVTPLTSNPEARTPNSQLLTLSWSAKEAMFKWFGDGAVDFRQHMQINTISGDTGQGWITCTFSKLVVTNLSVEYLIFDGLVMAWVVT
ncbi:MAG: 4'-phosphopantetheinyl transferase superfamily protein [Chitinophagaceae bacterium]